DGGSPTNPRFTPQCYKRKNRRVWLNIYVMPDGYIHIEVNLPPQPDVGGDPCSSTYNCSLADICIGRNRSIRMNNSFWLKSSLNCCSINLFPNSTITDAYDVMSVFRESCKNLCRT